MSDAPKIAEEDIDRLDEHARAVLDAADDADRAIDRVRSSAKSLRRLFEAAHGAAIARERPTDPDLTVEGGPPSVPPKGAA